MKYFAALVVVLFTFSCKKDKDQGAVIDNAFAIYIRNAGDSTDLWYAKQDGASFTKVISQGTGIDALSSPAWSADRRTIYFTRNTNRNNENGIYSVKPNGQDFKAIYKDNESQSRKFYQMVAADNDEYVVFSLHIPRSGRTVVELYSMCPCGQRIQRLTNFETSNPTPSGTEAYGGSFSKGSEYLYFSQNYPSANDLKDVNIYRMKMPGGELTLLKTIKAKTALGAVPSVSPDGESILISVDNAIHIMNSDGSNYTTLGIIKGYRPQWDANSKDIYFSSMGITGLTPGIYKTDRTAATPVMVSRNASAGAYGGFALNN